MTIQDYGSIGEIVGAVATIATLVYLALQIRQNSTLLHSTMATSLRDGHNAFSQLLASDGEAVRVFWDGNESRGDLSENDRRRFDALVSMSTNIWEASFTVGIHEKEGSRWAWQMSLPGWQEWWKIYGSVYSDEFRALIDQLLSDARASR